jgi:hypothetical protein
MDDGQLLIQQAASTDGPGLVRDVTQYSPQSTYIYRILQCMSLVGIGTLPPPHSQASVPCPPPPQTKGGGGGGHHPPRLGGWGVAKAKDCVKA